jgi:DNA polymerase III alpha subunit
MQFFQNLPDFEFPREFGKEFITAALSHGFEQQQAVNLFDLIASFAPFAFNKSHAVAYTIIAYQTAYLKAHFPKEFKKACKKYGKIAII